MPERGEKSDTSKKVDAFRLLYGAISLPFGGILGSLLTNVGRRVATAGPSEVAWPAFMLAISIIALLLFFALVPLVCEGVIRGHMAGRALTGLIVLSIVWCAVIMPSVEFGVPYVLWLVTIGPWLLCCAVLCAVCRFADIQKSMFND